MTPTRKRFYIVLIVVCVFLSAGLWIWSTSSGPVTSISTNEQNVNQTLNNISPKAVVDPEGNVSYPPPSVFPANAKFDTTVLNSSDFKALVPYTPVTITSAELGRDDPFKNY